MKLGATPTIVGNLEHDRGSPRPYPQSIRERGSADFVVDFKHWEKKTRKSPQYLEDLERGVGKMSEK